MDQTRVYGWYEQYKNGIFRYILSITKDPYLAEDVLHDTFVKLLSGEKQCACGKEQAWLYRIARNLCYDQLRKSTACPGRQSMGIHRVDCVAFSHRTGNCNLKDCGRIES